MNLQQFVDQIEAMTCIMSVEEKEDGSCGEIRIVTGNKAYIDSIENPSPDVPLLKASRFVPNCLYERYIPKDLNFELFCYNCAVGKKPMHTYVHPERFDFWFDMVTVKANGKVLVKPTEDSSVTVENGIYEIHGNNTILAKPINKNITGLTIPATVKANGKTYPVVEIKASACKGLKN